MDAKLCHKHSHSHSQAQPVHRHLASNDSISPLIPARASAMADASTPASAAACTASSSAIEDRLPSSAPQRQAQFSWVGKLAHKLGWGMECHQRRFLAQLAIVGLPPPSHSQKNLLQKKRAHPVPAPLHRSPLERAPRCRPQILRPPPPLGCPPRCQQRCPARRQPARLLLQRPPPCPLHRGCHPPGSPPQQLQPQPQGTPLLQRPQHQGRCWPPQHLPRPPPPAQPLQQQQQLPPPPPSPLPHPPQELAR